MNHYDFGNILKELRNRRNYSQAQLSTKLNKSKTIVNKYENNLALPSLETLIDIAAIFNVSLDYLVGLDKKKSISVEGLNDYQIKMIENFIAEIKKANK